MKPFEFVKTYDYEQCISALQYYQERILRANRKRLPPWLPEMLPVMEEGKIVVLERLNSLSK